MFGIGTSSKSAVVEQASEASLDESAPVEQLWAPAQAKARKAVEQLLLERGHVSEDQLAQARQVQSQTPGKSIPQIFLTMNAASEGQILAAVAETLGLPFEAPEKGAINPQAFALLSADYIRKHLVLPIRFEELTLVVGMADPTNVFLLDEVKRKVKKPLKVVVTPAGDINRVVEQITTT